MRKRVNYARLIFRLLTAAAILIAVTVQLLHGLRVNGFNAWNFFSYFTIQSNLIAAAVLVWSAFSKPSAFMDMCRGAATMYMAITGVVFALLLAHLDLGLTLPAVNVVLHQLVPVVMVVDWLLDPPGQPLGFQRIWHWLAYPIAWLAYTMVRALTVHWYPYPFLNPANGGYGQVFAYVAAIIIFALTVASTLVLVGNALARRRKR